MKTWRSFYHFLGSIQLAIVLIATVAVLVVAGTLLESAKQSHGYAAALTYGHPFFTFLLGLFFVNILVSALRRWPFQTKHIPFLITHFGLLMILTGCLIKSWIGLQGNMLLVEGSASQQLLIPNSRTLHIQSGSMTEDWKLHKQWMGPWILSPPKDPAYQVELLEYVPNSRERLELWTKDNRLLIDGLPAVALTEWNASDPLPDTHTHRALLHPGIETPWAVKAYRTDDIATLAGHLFVHGLNLRLINRDNEQVLLDIPFVDALKTPVTFPGGAVTAKYDLDFSPLTGIGSPHALLSLTLASQKTLEQIRIPLNEDGALLNTNISSPWLGHHTIRAELVREPTLVVLNDSFDDDYLWTFDRHGCVECQIFRPGQLDSLMVYEGGRQGYAVEASLKTPGDPSDLTTRESAQRSELLSGLRQSLQQTSQLAPPLELLQSACVQSGLDFASLCIDFLYSWDHSHSWLYPSDKQLSPDLSKTMNAIKWTSQPEPIQRAAMWSHAFLTDLEAKYREGGDLFSYVKERGWPKALWETNTDRPDSLFSSLNEQLFVLADALPATPLIEPQTPEETAHLFSAYLRAYGLHLGDLLSDDVAHLPPSPACTLYCRVTRHHLVIPPTPRLEDNLPLIAAMVTKDKSTEVIPLTFDRFATGLKWPIHDGRALARFQPQQITIPYRVRLRDARQVAYPNSAQPFSYEAEIFVTDTRTGKSVDASLTMNHVYETEDGYRFYLSNISPATETAIRRVQLAVNYDPARYWLTYPGGGVLALGIVMLFTLRPYRRKE